MRFLDRVHVCQYAFVHREVLIRIRIHPPGAVVSGGGYRPDMTISPNSRENVWVLEATIWAARAAEPHWQEQLNTLGSVAAYDPKTQTWRARLGALDLAGLEMLQILLDAAGTHGTEVRLVPVAVPPQWNGPVFTADSELAAVLEAKADEGRALGQLHLV
ncbi:hypothetical protein GCM10010306_021640 [Streptomyces umbrinus]|nr:hypothetical protein GCM10010306_021640 [Streptomyces umbrinus]